MRDENGNWTIAKERHRVQGEKFFKQTELIKAIKIILKHHCSDIKAQKCVCCELSRLREVVRGCEMEKQREDSSASTEYG